MDLIRCFCLVILSLFLVMGCAHVSTSSSENTEDIVYNANASPGDCSCSSDIEPVPETLFEKISEKVARAVFKWASKREGIRDLVVEHELKDVTPEMMDWWWDNIDTTERYAQWHPLDHISFEWIAVPEQGGHIGREQLVRERIAGIPMSILIRWEDPGSVTHEYEYVLAASGKIGDNKRFYFKHEYEAGENALKLRSTFSLPSKLPDFFFRGLEEHCHEEFQYLSGFLPKLYECKMRDNITGGE